jgi:hypothetical protein
MRSMRADVHPASTRQRNVTYRIAEIVRRTYRFSMRRLLLLSLALLLPVAAQAASTPAEAYRALQKAAEARDEKAMAAVLTPDEREALKSDIAKEGIAITARRVPRGPLKIVSEAADLVAAEADGRAILFVREESRWYVAAIFAKPKKPVAEIQFEPSVRAEKGEVVTVGPIRGAGMPNQHSISAAKAYELLRAEALKVRPEVHLYTLDTGMHALSADGGSSGWAAEFLTGTPGEMLTVVYEDGDVEAPYLSNAPAGRPGVPEETLLGYDLKPLYDQTVGYAAGVVEPITRVTAALYRSAGSGKALWMLDVYGDDDRIGQTVVFEARTMKYSHKTK